MLPSLEPMHGSLKKYSKCVLGLNVHFCDSRVNFMVNVKTCLVVISFHGHIFAPCTAVRIIFILLESANSTQNCKSVFFNKSYSRFCHQILLLKSVTNIVQIENLNNDFCSYFNLRPPISLSIYCTSKAF